MGMAVEHRERHDDQRRQRQRGPDTATIATT
jgi:hypothetical protein